MHDWRREIAARLSGLNLTPAREAEILDEWSQHLSDREAALVAAGCGADDARRQTREELQGVDFRRPDLDRAPVTPDAAQLAAPARWQPSQVWQDLRYAVRTLRHARGYAVAATLALALGIGATAAIVGALDAILLRPMPFPHADRLVVPVSVNTARGIDEGSTSFADYMDWREETDVFDAVALWRPIAIDITGAGDPERVEAEQVSEEFFRVIDVRPIAGRTLQPGDHEAAAPRVTVLSHRLWQQRFGGRDVLGTTLSIGGVPHEIVGVLPPRVIWPDTGDLFLPIRPALLTEDIRLRRDNLIYQNFARLKPGVSIEQGNARLEALAARLEQAEPVIRQGWTNRLVPLREYIVPADVGRALWVLLGAVAAVLLLVCANVATLSLVRGQARARELAIRLALGASRTRLIQQLLLEAALLAGLGALLGAAAGYAAMRGLVLMAPDGTPFLDTIGLNGRFLVATGLIALATLVLAGLVPALASSSLRPSGALKEGTAGSGAPARSIRLRHALVIAEIAAAVVLLVGASLLVRSFTRLTGVAPGADVDRVLTGRVSLPSARYPDAGRRAQFYSAVTARLEAQPEIEAAAAASFVPAGIGGFGLGRVFLAEGRPEPPAGPDVAARWNVVTPNYFRATGIPVTAGRPFTDQDRAGTTPVAIVTESFARRMFPGQSSLGHRVRSWRDENVLREIVGIVADVKYEGLADTERPLVYVPHAQDAWGSMLLLVRARGGDPARLEPTLRSVVTAQDPQLALARVTTMVAAARGSIAAQRYATVLVSLLAAVALVLAVLGIYGVMSYVLALRRREFGLRVALGATRGRVYGLVFRYAAGLTIAGLACGVAGGAAASRGLAALLYDTSPADALAWGGMAALVLGASALACVIPARRSARVDPIVALRGE